jgi:dolichol-phosphate mannosyltransferase
LNIVVVLPVYNEERSLDSLFERFTSVVSTVTYSLRFVAVDDGSTDRSLSRLKYWRDKFHIEIIRNRVNTGLGYTLQRGLTRAAAVAHQGDVVITMDADNTHPPELIERMVARLEIGRDIVVASRYQHSSRLVGLSRFRQTMSDGARILFQLFVGVPGVRDYTCGYRAYRAELLQRALAEFAGCLSGERGFACTAEILLRCASLKARIEEVPLELRYDFKGSASKMDVPATALRLLRLAWKNRQLMSPRESHPNWRSVISPASRTAP